MADVQDSLEFYKLKVFLYKYTPEFRLKSGANSGNLPPQAKTTDEDVAPKGATSATESPINTPGFQQIERYEIDLDEKYFRKIDISEFVSSYTFNQEINGNTFDWNIVFHNSLIPFDRLGSNKDLILKGSPISPPTIADDGTFTFSEEMKHLAMYESQASKMFDEDFISTAKIERGITEARYETRNKPFSENTDLPPDRKEGLYLHDIIQPFDIISVFLYKGNTPVEDLRGTFTGTGESRTFIETPTKSSRDVSIVNALSGKTLKPSDLQNESILLSPSTHDPKLTLFSNEFTGFALSKSFSREAGSPDILTVGGNGITRLFGSTRRVIKSSVMQSNIYEINQIVQPDAFTPFQNVYVGKTIQDIFLDLFNIVYRVKGKINESFYDIAGLKTSNAFQTNLFTIPPFLLALVMDRLGYSKRTGDVLDTVFDVLEGKKNPTIMKQFFEYQKQGDEIKEVNKIVEKDKNLKIDQNFVDFILNQSDDLELLTRKSPIFFSRELDSLVPYFKFIEDVLTFFSPEMRTPFEIIDELKEKTFLEFFETPEGIIYIRPPAYNDTTNVIFSSTLDVISSNYSENAGQIITRQNVGYADDALPGVEAIKLFSYVTGKYLLQYGLMEATADANPNAKNEKQEDRSQELLRKKSPGLFKYGEYLLRLHNASLKTGNITAVYDPKLRVGRTYFDERNKKFGYITNISKAVNTGSQSTVSFTLTYVRDCYLADEKQVETSVGFIDNPETGEIEEVDASGQEFDNQVDRVFDIEKRNDALDGKFLNFEVLTRLVDLAQEFSLNPLDKKNTEYEPGDKN